MASSRPVFTELKFDFDPSKEISTSMYDVLSEIDEGETTIVDNGRVKDYTVFFPATKTYVAETQGRRGNQEDRYKIIEHVPGYSFLSDEERNKVFESVFTSITADLAVQYKSLDDLIPSCNIGSCALSVAMTGSKVEVANLGDSAAYAIIIHRNGLVEANRINPLHNPYEPSENKRIRNEFKETGRYLHYLLDDCYINPNVSSAGRLPSDIAISRALGDFDAVECGLSHEPEITHYTFPATDPESKAFILFACDGLTEGLNGRIRARNREQMVNYFSELKEKETEFLEKYISEFLQADEDFKHNFTIPNIPALLIQKAIANGSRDNITAGMLAKEPHLPITKMAAIFDGHGGEQVAQFCADVFAERVQEAVVKMLCREHAEVDVDVLAASAAEQPVVQPILESPMLPESDTARPSVGGVFGSRGNYASTSVSCEDLRSVGNPERLSSR